MSSTKQHIVSWRALVCIGSGEKKIERVYHFTTARLAEAFIVDAYERRLAQLMRIQAKDPVMQIQTWPLGSGSSNPKARKLVWSSSSDYAKEYFDFRKEVVERRVYSTLPRGAR